MVNYFPETLLKSHPEVVFETNYIDPAVQGELPAPAYYCYYPAPPPPPPFNFQGPVLGPQSSHGGYFFHGCEPPWAQAANRAPALRRICAARPQLENRTINRAPFRGLGRPQSLPLDVLNIATFSLPGIKNSTINRAPFRCLGRLQSLPLDVLNIAIFFLPGI